VQIVHSPIGVAAGRAHWVRCTVTTELELLGEFTTKPWQVQVMLLCETSGGTGSSGYGARSAAAAAKSPITSLVTGKDPYGY
jgi:hypothetical protein